MGRRTLLIITSILCAALGTTLVYLYAQGADVRAQEATGMTSVLYFTGQAAAGTPLERLPLGHEAIPVGAARNVIATLGGSPGRRLTEDAHPGQLLVSDMLTTSAADAAGIPSDQGFVSLTIADPHRVPALIRKDTEVALYVVKRGGASGCVQLLVPRVRVYSVGYGQPLGAQGAPTIIGFLADPKTNLAIVSAETLGEPVLELLGDRAAAATPPVC